MVWSLILVTTQISTTFRYPVFLIGPLKGGSFGFGVGLGIRFSGLGVNVRTIVVICFLCHLAGLMVLGEDCVGNKYSRCCLVINSELSTFPHLARNIFNSLIVKFSKLVIPYTKPGNSNSPCF